MRDILLRARHTVALAVLTLICLVSLAACSQSQSSTQIPAGSSAALGSDGGSTPAPQDAALQSALTPDTRNTLQQAMNSSGG